MSGEEEFSMPWPYTTLQQRRDMAQPVAIALGSWLEDPVLLPVEPAHPQGDDRSLLLWHMGDILDEALDYKVTGTDGQENLSITAWPTRGR